MADQYPSLGIHADLSEIALLNSGLDKAEQAYYRVGKAREAAEKGGGAAIRQTASATSRAADTVVQSADRMSRAEQRAFNESLSAARQTMSFRERMNRQRIAEEQAVSRAVEAGARAEAKAADEILRAKVRAMRQAAAEQQASSRAEAAAIKRAEEESRREAQQTFEFRMRMNRQRAAEAIAVARADAASRDRWLGGGSSGGSGSGSSRGGVADVLGLGDAMERVRRTGAGFMGFLGGLRNLLGDVRSAFFDVKTAVAVLLAGMIVSPLIHMADAMTGLEARTRIYAARASDVPTTFEAIYRTAQDARVPLEAISTLYTRMAPLAERLGKSQLDILRTTSTVAKSFAIGGATPAEAASSSQQLAQALGSNRLGGDELRSLAENAPVLLAKISASLGMNTGEFIKWAHAGNANAKVIVQAIDDASSSIEAMFTQMPVTISQASTVMANAFQHLVGEVNTATGASAKIAGVIMDFVGFLEAQSTIDGVAAAVNGLGVAFNFLGQATSVVMQNLPTLAVGLVALGAASVLPPIFAAIGVAVMEMSVYMATAGGRAVLLSGALTGMQAAGAKAAAGIAAVLSPLNLLLIGAVAVTAGVVAVNNAVKASDNAFQNYADSSSRVGLALQAAADKSDAYGGSSKELNSILSDVIDTTDNRVTAEGRMATAASNRIRLEKIMAEAALRTAAADATAAAASARRQAVVMGVLAATNEFSAKWVPQTASQRQRDRDMGLEARRREGILTRSAQLQEELALKANAGADIVRNMEWNATSAEAGGGAGLDNNSKETKGMSGAINTIAKMRAEVAGLKRDIDSVSTNPLSDLATRIRNAGDEAAADRTAGKGAGFADEARTLAREREELSIRLDMVKASADAQRQSQDQAAAERILTAGRMEGLRVIQAYYDAGAQGANQYEDALDAAADANMRAKVAANDLAIAQRFGVTSLLDISEAYQRATGASKEAADTIQVSAIAEAAAAEAAEKQANATDKATRSVERLAAASKAQADQLERMRRLQAAANMTPEQRSVETETLIYKEQILSKARLEGKNITDQEAEARARILALIDKTIERTGQMKISIQDSIRQAFVESGKLDFSSLKRSLTQRLREAVYDALLAKPITFVVNAVVDVVTKGLDEALKKIANAIGGEEAGGDMTKALSNFFGEGGKFSSFMTNTFGAKGGQMASTVSNIAAVMPYAMMAQQANLAIGNMLGFDKKQMEATKWFGTIGGLLVGKESNHSAAAMLNANGTGFNVVGSKSTAETRTAAQSVGQAVVDMIARMKELGINGAGVINGIDIGSRDQTHIRLKNGMDIRSAVGDPQAAAEAAGKALLQYAQYENPQMRAMVDQLVQNNATFQEMVDKLETFTEAQKLPGQLDLALLAYSNPRAAALGTLQQQQLDRRKQINQYADAGMYTPAQLAAINATVTALERNEISDVVARFADTLDGAVHSLKDYAEAQQKIADYAKSLSTSAMSPLSPEAQLTLSGNNFFTTLNKARGGDFNALSSVTDVASDYLGRAQQQYGSSEAYNSIFQTVQDALTALSTQEFEDPLKTAIEDASEALQEAILAGSLAIVEAITGPAPGANDNDNPPLTTPQPGAGGGGGYTNPQYSAEHIQELIDSIKENGVITRAVGEAIVGTQALGLDKVAATIDDSASMARIRGGGGVRTA